MGLVKTKHHTHIEKGAWSVVQNAIDIRCNYKIVSVVAHVLKKNVQELSTADTGYSKENISFQDMKF